MKNQKFKNFVGNYYCVILVDDKIKLNQLNKLIMIKLFCSANKIGL